tara:strand:- start:731 stop:1513 length:783 start_codon:yes stop_codon:yes gene_type:complete
MPRVTSDNVSTSWEYDICTVLITATDFIGNATGGSGSSGGGTTAAPSSAPTFLGNTTGANSTIPGSFLPPLFDAKNCDNLTCFLINFYGISSIFVLVVFALVPLLRACCPTVYQWRVQRGYIDAPSERQLVIFAHRALSRCLDGMLPLVWIRSLCCSCSCCRTAFRGKVVVGNEAGSDNSAKEELPLCCRALCKVFNLELSTLLMPMSEVRRVAGTDAVLELRVLQMAREICVAACLLGIPLLFVNVCGTGEFFVCFCIV